MPCFSVTWRISEQEFSSLEVGAKILVWQDLLAAQIITELCKATWEDQGAETLNQVSSQMPGDVGFGLDFPVIVALPCL